MSWIDALKDDKVRQTIRDVGVILLFGFYMWINHMEKMMAMEGEAVRMINVLERQVVQDEKLTRAVSSMVETYTGKKLPE